MYKLCADQLQPEVAGWSITDESRKRLRSKCSEFQQDLEATVDLAQQLSLVCERITEQDVFPKASILAADLSSTLMKVTAVAHRSVLLSTSEPVIRSFAAAASCLLNRNLGQDHFSCVLNLATCCIVGAAATGAQLATSIGSDEAILNVLATRSLRGSIAEAVVSAKPSLSKSWLLFITAVNQVFRSSRFVTTSLLHRMVPILAKCVSHSYPGCSAAAVAVTQAAVALLQIMLAFGDAELQSSIIEELVASAVCGSLAQNAEIGEVHLSKYPNTRKAQTSSTSAFTSALLAAVMAPCLWGLQECKQPSNFAQDAAECIALSDSHASALASGLLRRCLLAVKERDAEPEAWARLELIISDLIEACWSPSNASAPTLLLYFAKGLFCIASTSRSADLTCTQRELSVKLLGLIASFGEHQLASGSRRTSPAANVSEKEWAYLSELTGCSLNNCTVTTVDETVQLIVSFLEQAAQKGNRSVLEFNCAYLLCFWARPKSTQVQTKCAGSKKSRANTRKAQAQALDDETHSSVSLLLSQWAGMCLPPIALPAIAEEQLAQRSSPGAAAAAALYSRLLLSEEGSVSKSADDNEEAIVDGCISPLQRARSVALNGLLGQLKSNPLVHVRRQALLGIAAARSTTPAASVHIGELAVSLGLRDESPLVRASAVDLSITLLGEQCEDRHVAVAARLADVSTCVRRAAFRASCLLLKPDLPSHILISQAAELIRRIRDEVPSIREMVLAALERAFFPSPFTEDAVKQLLSVTKCPGVGRSGLHDLLMTHHSVGAETKVYFQKLVESTSTALQAAFLEDGTREEEDMVALTFMAEELGRLSPGVWHLHLPSLQEHLDRLLANPSYVSHRQNLICSSCRVFSDVLGSWISFQEELPLKEQVCEKLISSCRKILQESSSYLIRAAVESLCVVSSFAKTLKVGVTACEEVSTRFIVDLQHLEQLSEAGHKSPLTASDQRQLCERAWFLASVLEFADLDSILAENVQRSCNTESAVVLHDSPSMALRACRVLCHLCEQSPERLRVSLLPCLGFLLRRHPTLLRSHDGSVGPLAVLRKAIVHTCGPLSLASLQVLSSLLKAYEKAVQDQTIENNGDWGEAVAQASKMPAVSEAVQQLATLQTDIILKLQRTGMNVTSMHLMAGSALHAIQALHALSNLGVLHPASAVPTLLAHCLSGPTQEVAIAAFKILQKLLESSQQLFLSAFSRALFESSASLVCARPAGFAAMDSWRFAGVNKVYSEVLDTKRFRGRFVDSLLAQVLSCCASLGSKALVSKCEQIQQNYSELALRRLELVLGLLAHLHIKTENELAQIVTAAAQCLTLRVLPCLQNDLSEEHRLTPIACAASLGLFHLVEYLCAAAGGSALLVRLLSNVGEAEVSNVGDSTMAQDKLLPSTFARRPPPAFVEHVLSCVNASSSNAALLTLLIDQIPIDSPLLRFGSATAKVFQPSFSSTRTKKRSVDCHGQNVSNQKRARAKKVEVTQCEASMSTPAFAVAAGGA